MHDHTDRVLGRSGLRVSPLALGTMTFGTEWGGGPEPDEARRIFDAYVNRGGNFIDTAKVYGNGTSERLVGQFAAQHRDRLVIVIKFSMATRPGDLNSGGKHRKSLLRSVQASLRRLRTDHIDLVTAGKVLARPATRACSRELEIGVTTWSPLASGVLSAKYGRFDLDANGGPMGLAQGVCGRQWGSHAARARDRGGGPRAGRRARAIAVAGRAHVDAAELRRDAPVIGARTAAQLEENLCALDVTLSDTLRARLEEASAIELGFPQDYLARPFTRGLMQAGTTIAA